MIEGAPISFDPTKRIQELDDQILLKNFEFKDNPIVLSDSKSILNLDDFKITKKLDSRRRYAVFNVKEKVTKMKFRAISYFSEISKFLRNEIVNLCQQVNVIAQLDHPCIRKFIGYSHVDFDNKPKPVIIEEIQNSTLKSMSEIDETNKLVLIYGIALGMSYLHSHDIIHRNLKPGNVFISKFWIPKISGFELSYEGENAMKGRIQGSPAYLAPEVYLNQEYSKASDVYSFALLMFEIMTSKSPFIELETVDDLYEEVVVNKKRPEFEKVIPSCYRDLIERCWSQNPKERPTFDQIVSELRTNPEFITDFVHKEYFIKLIDYLDGIESNFYPSKKITQLDDILKSKIHTFLDIDIFLGLKSLYKTEYINIKLNNTDNFVNKLQLEEYEEEQSENSDLDDENKIEQFYRFGKYFSEKESEFFIVKTASKRPLDFFKFELVNFCRELNIILQLNNPTILKCYGYLPYNYYSEPEIITECFSNCSLAKKIDSIRNPKTKKKESSSSEYEHSYLKEEEEEEFNSDENDTEKEEEDSEKEDKSDENDLEKEDESNRKNEEEEEESSEEITDTEKLIIIYGIAAGMSYLHSHDIIHRDLKPESILIDSINYPKITGFDISIEINKFNDKSRIQGTPAFLAPEVYLNCEYSKASDVYSFALLMYEVLTYKRPYLELFCPKNIYESVALHGYRPKFEKPIPECYRNLIERCWSQNPQERPTFDEIVFELKTNKQFITETVDEEEFYEYIQTIENTPATFESSKRIHLLDQFVQAKLWRFPDFEYSINLKSIYQTETNKVIPSTEFINIEKYRKIKKISFVEDDTADYDIIEIMEKETGKLYSAISYGVCINDYSDDNFIKYTQKLDRIAKLNHPGFIKFIGYSPIDFKNRPYPLIITENVSNSTLEGLIRSHLNETIKLIILYGIASALAYSHSHDVLHQNLKTRLIFLNDYLFPKMAAMGMQEECFIIEKEYEEDDDENALQFDMGVALEYCAPEVLKEMKFSPASDVYSYAIIAYELISDDFACDDNLSFEVKDVVFGGKRPIIKESIPKCYRTLIEKCWSQEPNERPSFNEIVHHLKTNKEFISDKVNKKQFEEYVKMIDESIDEFETNKGFKVINDYIEYENEAFRAFKIYKNRMKKLKNVRFSIDMGSIDINIFKKQKKIGEGGFGAVYKALNKSTGEVCAVKVSKFEMDECRDSIIIDLTREIEIMSMLNHPCILKFIGYSPTNFKSKSKPTIITEFLSRGSLDKILELERKGQAPNDWDNTKKLINIYGIASSMKYLHHLRIIHRDLKPANILLDEFLHPKLADFGLSKSLDEKKSDEKKVKGSGLKGTYAYISPEIFKKYQYTYYGDVYAFGMIVFEIMTSETIFKGWNPYFLAHEVSNGYRPTFNYMIPYCYRKLIEKCWSKKKHDRPEFDKICELLKTNPDFVTDFVDQEEFLEYVEMIDESLNNKETNNILFKKQTYSSNQEIDEKSADKEEINLEDCFININDYKKEELIIKRDFSKLYKIKELKTGNLCIALVSTIKVESISDDEISNFSNELNKISKLNDQSVLKFIGYSPIDFKNKKKPAIITEYLSNGTLDQIISYERENNIIPGWNETKKLINIYGIASGMSYLHSHDIIHRNLKPENIFLDDYLFPKIGDFGLLTRFWSKDEMTHQSISGLMANPIYSSPEAIQFNEYSKSSDVYSFAFIVYEILTSEVPFGEFDSNNKIYNEIVNKGNRPKFNKEIPVCYRELIEKCWSQDPTERPTFDEIVSWLKNNQDFINEKKINKNDYLKYITFIEENQKNSSFPKKVHEFEKGSTSQVRIKEVNVDLNEQQSATENLAKLNDKQQTIDTFGSDENNQNTNAIQNTIDGFMDLNATENNANEQKGTLNKPTNTKEPIDSNEDSESKEYTDANEETDASGSNDINEDSYSNDESNDANEDSCSYENNEDTGASESDESNEDSYSNESAEDTSTNESNTLNKDNDSNESNNSSRANKDDENDESVVDRSSNERSNLIEVNKEDGVNDSDQNQKQEVTVRSVQLDAFIPNDNHQSISLTELISSQNAKDLMIFLNENYNYDKTNSVFNTCYSESPDFFLSMCKEGMAMNNPVAHHKYAMHLINSKNANSSNEDKIMKYQEAQKHLEESIKRGFYLSCFVHARISHEVFHKDDSAYEVAREGAQHNEKYSKCLLGYFTAHGVGTEKNHKKGVSMMLESETEDCYELFATDIGIYYAGLSEETSTQKKKNEKLAFEWFEKAFKTKQTKASINNYGICYLRGFGVDANIEKAKDIFALGVQKEDPNSMYHMGFILENTDSDCSSKLYKRAADEGNLYAQLKCASIEKEESLKYFRKAAELGNKESQKNLARNRSVENDEERTFEYMEKLIKSGNYFVPLDYAISLYKSGQYSQAFGYFSIISKYNNPIARYFIGVMMFHGLGCAKNREKSYEIMSDLASKGIDKASEFIETKFND